MVELDLQINNQSRWPINSERLFGAIRNVLNGEERIAKNKSVSVSLLIVNKTEMAEYNLRYHDTIGPTDVLSFPYTDSQSLPEGGEAFVTPPDAGVVLGDIIVCDEVAKEVAEKEQKTVDEVIEFYVLHGLQHLLGHHHD